MKNKHYYQSLFLIVVVGLLSACQHKLSSKGCGVVIKSNGSCEQKIQERDSSGPLDYTLYVRGGFNGWGSDKPFEHQGGGVYQATVLVPPGNHEFKLAPIDWSVEWVIANAGKKPARLNQKYLLEKGGSGSFLFVRKTAYYKFSVNFSDPGSPSLIIVDIGEPKRVSVNVHQGHKFIEHVELVTGDGIRETVTFSVDDLDHKLRRYAQSTTQTLRDPVPQYVRYQEIGVLPKVRSGNLQFDALFALALEEMRLNSVDDIEDGNYNEGRSIPCECFETGEKWHYVWTRDLSYAADLGLAMFDPQRVINSLLFKLSDYREGINKAPAVPGSESGLQIVQDTGTGGSWPISTDRVSWAFGAAKVLQNIPSVKRRAFAKTAYVALKNTIEIDRVAVFDDRDGLYTGEQSFLDWREQSYASWVVNDIASLGSSKSLSTNVGHFQALRLASELAQELGERVEGIKYRDWAEDLKSAINLRFWLPDVGLYSSITAGHFDGAPLYKYDWLGLSLAVITGVAEDHRAMQSVANYPHGPMGAPVIFPQQPGIPIYHNRALWPFVTAYGLKAAIQVGNSQVADAAYQTLIQSAALNLSNMENLEWLSGKPLFLDETHPELSGPVVNSKRQLWSVGGYLGMVVDSLFGVKTSGAGVTFKPFVTNNLRREYFSNSNTIDLYDLVLQEKLFDIEIVLPALTEGQGYHTVDFVTVNGKRITGETPWRDLGKTNRVVVHLGGLIFDRQKITKVNGDPAAVNDPNLFAPPEPQIGGVEIQSDEVLFSIEDKNSHNSLHYTLFKNGKKSAQTSLEKEIADGAIFEKGGACYSIAAKYEVSGTVSHHSVPRCMKEGEEVSVTDQRLSSNILPTYAKNRVGAFISDWGKPNDRLELKRITLTSDGDYAFQVKYHNAYNEINLGITNGVKWMTVRDKNNNQVASGVIQMPHANVVKGKHRWVLSTPLITPLRAGVYSIELEDFFNMSYFSSNKTFTNNGGVTGPINRVDIAGFKITQISEMP